jgi:hypothetical protein
MSCGVLELFRECRHPECVLFRFATPKFVVEKADWACQVTCGMRCRVGVLLCGWMKQGKCSEGVALVHERKLQLF